MKGEESKMARFIKKLVNVHVFHCRSGTSKALETETDMDEYEWKGWDAWVDIKK
jgi:hypothetical protein|tara:strand:- start:1060 stop:1221 length:162 start_codon:yes stop_codon:yes gene_type:complete